MKKFFFLAFCALGFAAPAPAQLLKNLKDRALDKGRSEVNNTKNNAKSKAREAAHKQLDELNDVFDSTDVDYAILLSDNAGLYGGRARNEFVAKFRQLGGIANSLVKDADLNDEENARLNLQLGQSGYAMGRFVYAEKRLKASCLYFEKAYLAEDPGYIKANSSLGLLYASMGRYQQAGQFTGKALDLRIRKLGPNSMSVAASENNQAVLHYNLGRYNESESGFDQALALISANGQVGTMPHCILLNNKAILFQALGRYEAAEKLLQEAIGYNDSRLKRPEAGRRFYSNLALLYQQMGKYEEAEQIYTRLEKLLDKKSSAYANLLNNRGILYLLMQKNDQVEDMLKRSASLYKSVWSEQNPAYAKVISDLGNFYRYQGRKEEAEPLLNQALQVRRELLGGNHPLYVQSVEDMALLHWAKNDLAAAVPLYREAIQKTLDFINRYFGPMSEAEKTRYWDILAPRFQRFYNFVLAAAASNPDLLNDMLACRIATKGLLLRSVRKLGQSILGSGDPQLVADYNDWIDGKEQLAALYAYSREELNEQNIRIDSLEDAVNQAEKRLSARSAAFRDFLFVPPADPAPLAAALQKGEALVEIVRLRQFDRVLTGDYRYAALVLTNGNVQPKLIPYPAGDDLEGKAARTYRVSVKNKVADEQSYASFWQPLEPALTGIKTVYVSPDGVFNQVSLNTLKKKGGDYLINLYDIEILGNPSGILNRTTKKQAAERKATLLGNPDFGGGNIVQLPGTRAEVDGIQKLLKTSGYQVAEWVQKDATESNLKNARNLSVLHLATHGYFLKDPEKTNWPIGVQAEYARENVLLRSGLLLTGASQAEKDGQGLDSTNNGILTSYEAMGLRLEGTGLVVLSACETGLGEVKAGEGVYGLQRAFLAAGAEALVMSLWKVDDAATQQLMNIFYANWLRGMEKQKAFRQAQVQLMKTYKEPLYWGAFVMVED